MPAEPYDFREPADWAEGVAAFAQRRLNDGAVVVLYGDCPRCHHVMDVEIPIKLQTGGLTVTEARDSQSLERTRRARETRSASFAKTARCNCQMDHEGRPKDVGEGCGAFGTLEIG